MPPRAAHPNLLPPSNHIPTTTSRTTHPRRRAPDLIRLLVLVLGLGLTCLPFAQPIPAAEPEPAPEGSLPTYEQRSPSRDGIGKFHQGREISQVMGHQGADWLERPERLQEERPDLLHQLLALQPEMAVADIGAGTGYHSWRMAKAVGPKGKVYGVEIQPEMLGLLLANTRSHGVSNVVGVLGTPKDPKLPTNSLDLVLLVDVYHEFDHPFEMLAAITRSLKPNGRVAFVEFRAEDPNVPIKNLHKMSEAQIRKEAGQHPLEWVETRRELPWQHLVLFRKR